MHILLKESLEGYLSGALQPEKLAEVESHLAECSECREEFEGYHRFALGIRMLRPPEESDEQPRAGFYARVMARVEDERRLPFWNLLAEPAFGRRVVFACLLLMALLGAYVAAGDASYDPSLYRVEAVLASDQPGPLPPLRFGPDVNENRGVVLTTLAADTE